MTDRADNPLRAQDVERPLRDLLEDWEDAVKNALDRATREEAAKASVPGGQEMFRAIGLLNGAKDFGGHVLTTASVTVSPGWGLAWNLLSSASNMIRKSDDLGARLKVFQAEYGKLRDNIMDKIHTREINFPNTALGREVMQRVERAGSGLSFKDDVEKHTWAGIFLKEIGIIELNQSRIDEQMKHRYRPVFENLALILNASLYNDRSKLARMVGLDPNWKWDRGDVHVPGQHQDHGYTEHFGKPRRGFRHATPDEVKKIIVNLSSYRITAREFLVGTGYYASMEYVVEAVEQFEPATLPPDVDTVLGPLFRSDRVVAARDRAMREIGVGSTTVH